MRFTLNKLLNYLEKPGYAGLFVITNKLKNMITIKKLTKNILDKLLFEEVSFVLDRKDKVGLVGPNGSGKSTLLKIMIGEIEPDSGDLKIEKETIGYLSQHLPFKENETVEDFLLIKENPNAKSIIEKIGLGNIPLDMKTLKLSGGQKTRLALAKVLLKKPSILLLDEPTNHLDLKGIEWLENFIRDFNGGVLIISHDRRLLDTSVNKILEIDAVNHTFVEYIGGYMEYLEQREKRIEKWEEDYRLQQKEKKRIEDWLEWKQIQARAHSNPTLGKQIRAMEKRLQREILDKEIKKPKNQKDMRIAELKGETHSAKLIVRGKNLTKKFGDKSILYNANFELRGNEHVLFAGENGCGKTTLLKMIIGETKPDSGEIKIGENVHFGYFAQEHEKLDTNKTVMEGFSSTPRLTASNNKENIRLILGSFLFSGQDVFKKVSSLSFGERVRLIFAKLTHQENELLILDEPTNHLDIPSREVIEEALSTYKGAIIVVSHDRHFLDKISLDKVLTISNGNIKESRV